MRMTKLRSLFRPRKKEAGHPRCFLYEKNQSLFGTHKKNKRFFIGNLLKALHINCIFQTIEYGESNGYRYRYGRTYGG